MASNGNLKPYTIIRLDIRKKGAPQFLAKRIEEGLRAGMGTFKIKVPEDGKSAYPSMCVPIAGVIDYYRRIHNCEFIPSSSLRKNSYLSHTSFLSAREYASNASRSYLDVVWRFTAEDQFEIVSGIVDAIRSKIVVESGVLESVELCLNEVTDNVLVHSAPSNTDDPPSGFVMAQCHAGESTIAIAVYDNGQGIYRSFRGSDYSPATPVEAIELALTRNVTSGDGQGRGMWMLSSIVECGKGSIEVNSGGARFLHEHTGKYKKAPVVSKVSSEIDGTTLVDFRLSAENKIDIASALGGYTPTNLWLENREDDKTDHIVLCVKKDSDGTGTRFAGKKFRTIIENAMNQSNRKVVLDFADIEVVSSSYADELLGILVQKYGFVAFANKVSLVGLTGLNAMIIDESIKTRFASS